eukprot:11176392-Lingulodinium_polyedra.AAC.1
MSIGKRVGCRFWHMRSRHPRPLHLGEEPPSAGWPQVPGGGFLCTPRLARAQFASHYIIG